LKRAVHTDLVQSLTYSEHLERAWSLIDETITVIIKLVTELSPVYIVRDRCVVRVDEDACR
jgi:hypothetical protein